MREPERSELFAFEIIRRVTGHTVRHVDDGSLPKMVDGSWTDQEGRQHLVEVTRLTDPAAAQLLALLDDRDWKLPAPAPTYQWTVSIDDPSIRISQLEEHIEDLLLCCETEQVARASRLPWAFLDDLPLGRHVREGRLDVWRTDAVNRGTLWVLPPGGGGAASDMQVVPPWLTDALTQAPLAAKVAKLNGWPGDVRHLFVGLDLYGVPFRVGYAFWDDHDTPSATPSLPVGLDGVWLCPRLRQPPLTWLPERGWERHPDAID